jgi:hypothetical protein
MSLRKLLYDTRCDLYLAGLSLLDVRVIGCDHTYVRVRVCGDLRIGVYIYDVRVCVCGFAVMYVCGFAVIYVLICFWVVCYT